MLVMILKIICKYRSQAIEPETDEDASSLPDMKMCFKIIVMGKQSTKHIAEIGLGMRQLCKKERHFQSKLENMILIKCYCKEQKT